jgi:RPA family protein
MEKRRITTVKTKVAPIVTGKFVKQEGFEPNYVLTDIGQRLSRVRVLGTVVDKFLSETGKFSAVTIDDGTATVRVKIFNAISMFDSVAVGSIVDVIGRVKEYNGEVYVAPEIIVVVDDHMFELLRELEIREQNKQTEKKREIVLTYKNQTTDVAELNRVVKERFGISEEEVEALLNTNAETAVVEEKLDGKALILDLISKLDTGQGCDYTELIEASKLAEEEIDRVVNELLSEGSCFEPKPGKIKKL